MNTLPSIPRKALYIAMALLPVMLLLGLTECYLRSISTQAYEKKLARNHALKNSLMIHRKSDDPLLIYELTPGAELDRQGIHYKINQSGFRDDEFPKLADSKAENEYRIVVLGDSVAWGWGVDMHQAWPQVLEQELQDALPGKHIEIFNLAVNGYATAQEVRVLGKYGLGFKPDLVILNYVLNDPEVEDGGLSWYFESIDRIEIIYKGKLFLSFLSNVAKLALGIDAPHPDNSGIDHYYLIHHSALFENVENGFSDLLKVTSADNIPVMIIVTPVFKYEKSQSYPWSGIHKQIHELADKNHFLFMDMQPQLSSFDGKDISFDEIHPNAEAHRMIAEALGKKLLEDKIVH